jgi:hypothetical protein
MLNVENGAFQLNLDDVSFQFIKYIDRKWLIFFHVLN